MSNPPGNVNQLPSEAYREATSSLVYRLSELMFGSLLASYILGFVGAIAGQLSQLSVRGPLGIGLLAIQYVCISIMFTYLTTSFYLTYHVGVLTLPRLSFHSIGRDFRIAVLQAVFFGFSLLQPALFPLLLAANILVSGRRKNEEYRRLAENLFKHCPQKTRDNPKDFPQFRKALAKRMRRKRYLSAWAPIGLGTISLGVLALIIGAIVIRLSLGLEYGEIAPPNWLSSLVDWLKNDWRLPPRLIEWMAQILLTPWGVRQMLVTSEVVLATILMSWHGRLVLERRASFTGFPIKSFGFCQFQSDTKANELAKASGEEHISNSGKNQESSGNIQKNPGDEMDEEFRELPDEVKKLCSELFDPR
jgi:hypothetical protein